MARSHLSLKQIRAPYNADNSESIKTKLDDFDDTLDGIQNTTDYKTSVRFATTANLNLATTGLTVIDGVTPVAGNRALVKNQSTASQNGIYLVGATAWTRATDCDASADVTSGMQVAVSEGTANGGKWFILTTADPITLATTNLVFTEQPNAADLASVAAGKGAALIGSQDVGTYYTGATVEAILQEIYARLIATDATGYASVQGIRDVATIFTATTVEAALAEVKALADAAIALAKKEVTIGHADLTEAANGVTQAINIGTALPANAIVLRAEVNIATLFSGGGASACKLDIGGTDIDAIAAQMDVFTGAATGALTPTPAGVHQAGKFSAEQLVATFDVDAGHALLGLDAGALTITVWYSILA